MTTRLSRTFQTAPAAVPRENTAKYLESAFRADGFEVPDWLVPDIEDGTAPTMKEKALENTVELVGEHGEDFVGTIWPRVQWAYDDDALREAGREEIGTLVSEVGESIDGVVVPKVGARDDVEAAIEVVADAERDAGLADGSVEVAVIIESALAVSDLRRVAALGRESRLAGLVFGPVDYTAELGGREINGERPRWDGLLEALSNEASANDIVAIGGPFDELFRERAGVTVYNADQYADQVEYEARLGLDGSWSLYPKQTVQANHIHMPTPDELERAVNNVTEFEEARDTGTGAVTIDGQMVDEATYKNFLNTVRFVQALHDSHPAQATAVYDDDLLAGVDAAEGT